VQETGERARAPRATAVEERQSWVWRRTVRTTIGVKHNPFLAKTSPNLRFL